MTERPKPRILRTIFLPPSHPFMLMTDEQFENLWGPHVARKAVEPIPLRHGEDAAKEG